MLVNYNSCCVSFFHGGGSESSCRCLSSNISRGLEATSGQFQSVLFADKQRRLGISWSRLPVACWDLVNVLYDISFTADPNSPRYGCCTKNIRYEPLILVKYIS